MLPGSLRLRACSWPLAAWRLCWPGPVARPVPRSAPLQLACRDQRTKLFERRYSDGGLTPLEFDGFPA